MTKLTDYLQTDNATATAMAIETERLSLGAPTETDVVRHSSLFHQPFSEEVCKKLCDIFDRYQVETSALRREGILAEIDNLFQNNTSPDSVPTMECILYASRRINSVIDNNAPLFDALANIVANCYGKNREISFDAVKHIFEHWNWNCQVGIALVGAIKAENNVARCEELLNKFENYRRNDNDSNHTLLKYKVKAMIVCGQDFAPEIETIIRQDLTGNNVADREIRTIILANRVAVFGQNPPNPRGVQNNQFVSALLWALNEGVTDNAVHTFAERVRQGNTDEQRRNLVLEQVLDSRSVARFCDIIRNNHYTNYIDCLPDLVRGFRQRGSLENECRVACTFCQMIKGMPNKQDRFTTFIENNQLSFDEGFKQLLTYLLDQHHQKACLRNAIRTYFSEECSDLLQEGIRQTDWYNREALQYTFEVFSQLLEQSRQNTDPHILTKLILLFQRTSNVLNEIIRQEHDFLNNFMTLLSDNTVDLDEYPEFFDAMIDIAEKCPPDLVRNFWYAAYQKTRDLNRKRRLQRHMGGPDVVDA